MAHTYRLWTEDEKKLADQLYAEHIPVAQIAKTLGRTERSIESYLVKHREKTGVGRVSPFTNREEAILLGLIMQGKTASAAIPFLPGRTECSIRRKYDRMHHKMRPEGENLESASARNQAQDEKFQLFMMAAIEAGLESAPIGIVKSPDIDFRPVKVQVRGETASLCGSPAFSCLL